MTNKATKAGSISRRRLLMTASAGAALAVWPFRINLLRAEEAPIKIGFPVPLTGPYGAEAQDQVRAGQLAVAQFNDAGGLNGRKAELVVRDDKLLAREVADERTQEDDDCNAQRHIAQRRRSQAEADDPRRLSHIERTTSRANRAIAAA